jgi:LysR family transcriptional regulator, flagellar master operon regulator
LVYSRARDSAVLQQALALLRGVVEAESDWSQRWDPMI